MELYKETEKPLQWKPSVQVRAKELATLDDLKAALAEHGLVAVNMTDLIDLFDTGFTSDEFCKQIDSMIKAVEGKQ